MTNFLNLDFEKESFYECLSCSEAITNPLCHNCLGEEVKTWLGFYPDLKRKFLPLLKKYIQEVNNSAMGAVNCVSCKKKKAALCPYCFTEGVLSLLKKSKTDKNIIGDFLSIFNFDLKHEGYIQDAISEGLY